ncbi:hypothetical protein J0W35_19095, partial [Clostridioides difficile]|nr:hypothetical protein [Clostridioides difficile]
VTNITMMQMIIYSTCTSSFVQVISPIDQRYMFDGVSQSLSHSSQHTFSFEPPDFFTTNK